jgi:hypothetical protein
MAGPVMVDWRASASPARVCGGRSSAKMHIHMFLCPSAPSLRATGPKNRSIDSQTRAHTQTHTHTTHRNPVQARLLPVGGGERGVRDGGPSHHPGPKGPALGASWLVCLGVWAGLWVGAGTFVRAWPDPMAPLFSPWMRVCTSKL